jgi:hypothetical protein
MKRIRRLLCLSSQEKRLLIKSACLLVLIRVGLSLLPFETLLRFLRRGPAPPYTSQSEDSVLIDRVAWAVSSTSRYIPFATCLTQALTANLLLRRLGQRSHLRIGVARNKEGKFEAHAWVESRGMIVIGRLRNLSRYTVLSHSNKEIL